MTAGDNEAISAAAAAEAQVQNGIKGSHEDSAATLQQPPLQLQPPQITITSRAINNRHNSIFCFDNGAYEEDEDDDDEDDYEVCEDAEIGAAQAARDNEDEEYAFEPELRFRVAKRSSSLVTFFRSFAPGRKTVTISEPEKEADGAEGKEGEEEETDSRRKSSTKMPPRSAPPLPPMPPPPSTPSQTPPAQPPKADAGQNSKSKDTLPQKPLPPLPKAPKRWIPFFSLFRYSSRVDRLLIAFGFFITFLATWPIPALNLIYGQIVNVLVHYEGTYYHKEEGGGSNNSTAASSRNFGAQSRGRLVLMDDFCDGRVERHDYYLLSQERNSHLKVFDSASFEHDYLLCQVHFLGVTLLLIAAWYVFACYLSMLCFELAAFRMSLTIRRRLFRALLRQDIAWFDQQTTFDVLKTTTSSAENSSSSKASSPSEAEGGSSRGDSKAKVKNTEFSTRVAKDLKAIEGGMNENLSMLLYFAFSVLWHAAFALFCGWQLALAIFLTSAPLIAVATGVMSKFNTSAVRKEMKAYGEAGAVAAEMFSAVRTVFAFGGERRALQLYDARLTPAVRSETRRSVVNSLGNALIWAGIYFGFAVGIWYGVRLMTTTTAGDSGSSGSKTWDEDGESEVSIGTIIVVFWCSAAVGWNAGSAAPYYEHILKACVVAQSVFETIEARPSINPISSSSSLSSSKRKKKGLKKPRRRSSGGSKGGGRHILPRSYTPSLEFRDVTFTYPSRRQKLAQLSLDELSSASTLETLIAPTLDSFSLAISAGEAVALVGPSGAGKSTVIQLLLRFYDPDNGSIHLDGVDIRSLDVGWLREQLGVVGQEPVLFDASVGDNIRLGAASGRLMSVTEAEVVAAAKEANAHEFIMRLPEGYNTMVGVRGAKLSGGQKQRIAIARALLKNPAILLLDEATSALDLRSEALVQAALDRAAAGRTTLIVAHRLSTVAKADRIVVLDGGGRILEVGSHEQLMAESSGGHFRRLVMRQMTTAAVDSSIEDSLDAKGVEDGEEASSLKIVEEEVEEEEEEEIKEDNVASRQKNAEDGFVDIPLRTLSLSRGRNIRQRITGWMSHSSAKPPAASSPSSQYSTLAVILRILKLLCQSRTAVILGVTCACLFGLCVPIYAFIFGNFVNVFTNRSSSSEVDLNSSSLITTTLSPLLPEAGSAAAAAEDYLNSLEGESGGEEVLLSERKLFHNSTLIKRKSTTTFGLDNEYLREQARNYAFQFLALAFFAFLSAFLQNSFFHIASQRLVTALRLLAFNSMLCKPVSWHEKPEHAAGRLCTTLANDPSDVQSSTGPRIAMLCQAGAALLVAVAFGLWTCWSLSLVALAFVPLIAYSSSTRVELFGEQNTKEAERNSQAAAVGAEAMANIRTVVSLHREAFFERYYASLLGLNVREVRCSIHKKSLHAAWALGCPLVAYATVFIYGGHLVADHTLSSGDFFRVIEAMIFGAIVFGQACFFSSDFAKAKQAATVLFELIDSKTDSESLPSVSPPPPPLHPNSSATSLSPPSAISPPPSTGMTLHLQYGRARGELSFRRVSFCYPSRPSVSVLREVTFHVAAGQKVALVGASGCGKTTILQLLERFYEPTDGLILLDGVSTANLSTSWLRAQMALVQQEPTLFNTTIRENIAYGDTSRPAIPMAEIEEAARKAAIHEWIASLPAAYETVVGVGGCQLSGGQKQRIAIARTWIRNPPILLLDEATSALDSNSEKQIQSTLEAALIGRTVITIAHRLSTVANADMILYLHQGAIVESGSHEELLARRGHYWGLYNAQRAGTGSSKTSKVDLVALAKAAEEKAEVVEVVEKINIVEREFRV